jgi:transposase InsO family protein
MPVTYIATGDDRLFLTAVIDLFGRHLMGWSMRADMTRDIVYRRAAHGYGSNVVARRRQGGSLTATAAAHTPVRTSSGYPLSTPQ